MPEHDLSNDNYQCIMCQGCYWTPQKHQLPHCHSYQELMCNVSAPKKTASIALSSYEHVCGSRRVSLAWLDHICQDLPVFTAFSIW